MQSNCAKSQSSPAEEEVPAMLQEISNNNATEVTTPEQFYWGEVKGSDFTKLIDSCYEKIVFGEKISSCFQVEALAKTSSGK